MWEDISCCFPYFELEDCPHLTGKTAQLLSGRGGIHPQIFFLISLAEMHTLVLYFLMYYEGGHRFQWCLGKHRFSCAQGGIWYLISLSYCCGQNRGIANCLLWSDMRILGHNFSRFLSTCVVTLDEVLQEALQLYWSHQPAATCAALLWGLPLGHVSRLVCPLLLFPFEFKMNFWL